MHSTGLEGRALRRATLVRALLLVLLLPAFALLLRDLREPVQGAHTFRQAHVAANVEKYVAQGLSLQPETYNVDVPGRLFDFPLYQLGVAALCRAFTLPAVPAARAVNVALFALALLALWQLLAAAGAGLHERALAVFFFAWSPLNLFYWGTPFVDPLAVLASILSLWGYLRWEQGRRGGYALMFVAGVAAALVKNPLYFPFFAAIAWERVRRRGARGLLEPSFAVFALALAAAVVLFKLYANSVNQAEGFLVREEAAAYFGTWSDRLRRKYWHALLESFGGRVLPSSAGLAAVAGLVLFAWRARRRFRALHAGLALGALVTLLLFFGRHREHDYYQLPFVVPAALFAGYAAHLTLTAGVLAWRSRQRALGVLAHLAVVALLAAAVTGALATRRALAAVPGPAELWERGVWLQAHTQRDDFVAVVVGTDEQNWDPSHLYFAQRDGCNLARTEITADKLEELRRRFAPHHRRFYVFVPWPQREALGGKLEGLGGRLEAAGEVGGLYRVEPAWIPR